MTPSTESLWQELHRHLWRFLVREVRDEALADDLLQETFLRVHDRLGSLDDNTRVTAWVYRIARNLIADHFRQGQSDERRRAAVAAQGGDAADADALLQGGEIARNQEVGGWLVQMLEQLPEHYREAVRLAEVEGLTQADVAARLGLSLSGAKSRIQRGRRKLREILAACCQVELDRRGNVLSTRRSEHRQCQPHHCQG